MADVCKECGEGVGFWAKLNSSEVVGGKLVLYCGNCKKRRNKIIKEVRRIMKQLGFFSDDMFKEHIGFALIGKDGKITCSILMNTILDKLKGQEFSEDIIRELVDYEKEKAKIISKERKVKVREEAEREIYGDNRNKRRAFDDELKEAIYSKYNNECAVCSAAEGLHIHHKDRNPSNNVMSNLILLCGVCHKKVHMKVR